MKTKNMILAFLLWLSAWAGAQAMGGREIEERALFLTDRMAYELGLNDYLADEVYQINYDFLCCASPLLAAVSVGDPYATRQYDALLQLRNDQLRALLGYNVWLGFSRIPAFFRPLHFAAGCWRLSLNFVAGNLLFYRAPRPAIVCNYHGGRYLRPDPHRGFYAPPVAPQPSHGVKSQRPAANPSRTEGAGGHRPGAQQGGHSAGNRGSNAARPAATTTTTPRRNAGTTVTTSSHRSNAAGSASTVSTRGGAASSPRNSGTVQRQQHNSRPSAGSRSASGNSRRQATQSTERRGAARR